MAELFAKYNCTNCQDDIPGIRVHCVECTDFDLCIQCFASGAEIGPHRNDHKYQLTDSAGTVQLSRAKGAWSGCEELRLLDAIEKYGFGNWEDVGRHIETRSADDAKDEYIAKYLSGCIGRNTWPHEQMPRLVDHTTADDRGPLSALLTERLPPTEVTAEEAAQLQYMPHRNDFEREYDPSAESLISTMVLSPDDDETDIVLKLAQIDIYTRRLRERTRRKRMVQDYQLIAQFFRCGAGASPAAVAQHRRRQTKEQREFRDRYRVFAQFYTSVEFNRRLAGLEREKALRVRLSELYRYRWNGLQTIAEALHFEQHAAVVQSKDVGPHGQFGKTDPATGEPQPSFSLCPPARRTPTAPGENEKPASSNSPDRRSTHRTGGLAYFGDSSHSRNSSDSSSNDALLSPPAHKRPKAGPVAEQPGGQLLSSSELTLCNNLNLPATRYVTMKAVLLSGSGPNTLPLSAAHQHPSLSSHHSGSTVGTGIESAVRTFLTKAGWLQHTGTA